MFVVIKNCSYKTVCLSLPLEFGPEGEMFIAGGVHFVCFTNFPNSGCVFVCRVINNKEILCSSDINELHRTSTTKQL